VKTGSEEEWWKSESDKPTTSRIWIASRQCSVVSRHASIHMQENYEFEWNKQRFYGKLHFRDAHSRVWQ
jgi:hypothetical protein